MSFKRSAAIEKKREKGSVAPVRESKAVFGNKALVDFSHKNSEEKRKDACNALSLHASAIASEEIYCHPSDKFLPEAEVLNAIRVIAENPNAVRDELALIATYSESETLKEAARKALDRTSLNSIVELMSANFSEVDFERIEQMLENGHDVDAKDNNGKTCLMLAAEYGSRKLVELFIARGADIDLTDNSERTALSYACVHANVEAAKALIAEGADVNSRDVFGNSILTLTLLYYGENSKIIQLLQENCAVR